MSAKTGRLLTRRRFLGQLALFASLASASRYGESLWADEPTSDPLGQTLPRRLLGRTEEKVTMLGLGGFHVGSLSDHDAQARSPTRSRRRQNWRNPGPRRVGQVGVVESRVHRTVPLARISALSRQTSTFQTPSKTTQGRAGTRSNAPVRVAFRYANSVGTLN